MMMEARHEKWDFSVLSSYIYAHCAIEERESWAEGATMDGEFDQNNASATALIVMKKNRIIWDRYRPMQDKGT